MTDMDNAEHVAALQAERDALSQAIRAEHRQLATAMGLDPDTTSFPHIWHQAKMLRFKMDAIAAEIMGYPADDEPMHLKEINLTVITVGDLFTAGFERGQWVLAQRVNKWLQTRTAAAQGSTPAQGQDDAAAGRTESEDGSDE